jgi:hypothetical protein
MKTKRLRSSMVSYFAKIRSKIAEVGLSADIPFRGSFRVKFMKRSTEWAHSCSGRALTISTMA